MKLRGVENVRGMHDIPGQTYIQHSTGDGGPYQELVNLTRDKERLEMQRKVWLAQLRRTEERLVQVERRMRGALHNLKPALAATEHELGLR